MVRTLEEMEVYAKQYNVPIMQKDGIEFLLEYIKKHHIKRILEIGTAIGYSAISMALLDKDIKIVTIERDRERYNLALQNMEQLGVASQIDVIYADAFDVELEEKFDLIFIDAAKAQYIKFFEKFKKNLIDTGVIISDNLNFHGLVHTDTKNLSRNVRGLVRKLNLYIEFLKNNEEFHTEFVEIGDGIGISTRK